MYKYKAVVVGLDPKPEATIEGGGSDMATKRAKRLRPSMNTTVDYIHFSIGLLYILTLITITILWNSPSLLALTSCHIVIVLLFYLLGVGENTVADRVFYFVFGGHEDKGSLIGLISWHMHNQHNNWVNLLHLLVLLGNFVFFLNYVQTDMPPSSILFSDQVTRDHNLFGTTGFNTIATPTMSMVELAPKGYYQLEEYKGKIGMNSVGNICGSTSDWKCFILGIRSPTPDGTGTWYQPLPSEGYDIDLQVAVGLQSVTTPPTCPTMFLQQVTGQGNVMGPFRPIMEFSWGSEANNTITPTGTLLGSITQQRQTFAQYVTSFQAQCTTTRTKHDDGGVKYSANYIPIPIANGGSVDKSSGGIRHTIVIMSTPVTSPPFIRITPKKSPLGMPLEFLFTPANSGIYDSISGKPDLYGDTAPIPELKTIPVPVDYSDRNYTSLIMSHGTLLVFLICVAWYYFVTMGHGYDTRSPIYTAMYVRMPLMMLGIYGRVFVYAATQFCLAVTMISYNPDKNNERTKMKLWGRERRHPLILYFMFWSSIGLGIGHVVAWGLFVIAKMRLLSFGPYLREMKDSNPLFPMGVLESSPMVQMLGVLLLLEPIMTLVMQFAILGNYWWKWAKS